MEIILFLCDDKQQIVTNGYSYLRVDSIFGCTVKGLDIQMLFNPLKESLNLPSFSILGQCIQILSLVLVTNAVLQTYEF